MMKFYPPRSRGRQLGIWGRFAVALCFLLATVAQAQVGSTLEQASNGTAESPISAVEWVTTTITAQRGHYAEGSSIPYRFVFHPLIQGAHRVVIAWDTKTDGRHATDYLTRFNRLTPHNQFGAHNVPETIQPLQDISGGLDGPFTFPIPAPPSLPGSSFHGLPANQRMFHIYNGTITAATYVTEGSLANDAAESRMAIDFTANDSPVVLLFGGHLASKTEWGAGQTLSGVASAAYRVRVVELDGLPSLLSVAVAAGAVVGQPSCNISGPAPVCPGTTNTYQASSDAPGASFAWSLIENSSDAAIIGSNSGPLVQVRSGNGGGSHTLQVSVSAGPLQSACAQRIIVWTNTSTSPLANITVCPGGTASFATQPTGAGPFTFLWRQGDKTLEGQTNQTLELRNVTPSDAGTYCVEVRGSCSTATACANLIVQSNTAATALANLNRCVGEGAVFSTMASGAGPFSYRWRKDGVEIGGQNSRILSVPNLKMADAGMYSVEVSGACNTVTNSARLVVYGLPACGIQGPASVCPEGGAGFAAPPNMAAFRWHVMGNGVIVGATNEQTVIVNGTMPGFLTLNLTVINSNGCARTCSRTITVGDIQAPVIICPENIQTNTTPGECSRTVDFAVSAIDNCETATVMCNPPTGTQFPKGTTTVNCSASDGAGNVAGCSFDVTVVDLENPKLTWPTNLVVNTRPGTCDAEVHFEAGVTDNCAGTSLICSPPSGTVFPLGTSSVNCRGSDAAGNVEFCTFEVTVLDNEAPRITCSPNLSFLADPGQCDVLVEYESQAADNCAIAAIVCVPPSGSIFLQGATTVICTATDVNQNQSSCTFEVQVDDGEKPRLVCPGDMTAMAEAGRCDAVVNFTYKASDNCRDATVICLPPSGARFNRGITSVTCTATDGAGNTAACAFTVNVIDDQRPALGCPQNVLTNTGTGRCDAVVYYGPLLTDNCGGATVECVPPSGSMFPAGQTVVNCFAMDASSNAVSCAFNVLVQDNEPPPLNCPGDILTNAAPGMCATAVTWTIPATDNCAGADVFCEPPNGSVFTVGETLVYCVALDASGNAQECAFTITVSDVEKPVISCPTDITLNTSAGRCDAIVSFTPSVTDNCPGSSVVCLPASGARFAVGQTPVICVATDASGNTNRCSFMVIVRDVERPEVLCPSDVFTVAAEGRCDAQVDFSATPLDNCPGATVQCVPPPGSQFSRGATVVACTATDASGNAAACAFTVTVNDHESPTLTCPTNIVAATSAGRCDAIVTFAPNATDNCTGLTVICAPPSGHPFPKGVTAVNCTVTDASGNTNHCAFTVTVEDREKPSITCAEPQPLLTDAGHCDAVATFDPLAADNCGGPSVACLPPSGSRFPPGVSTVTCTAIDGSGNIETCSFGVTVRDAQPPTIACPDDIAAPAEAGRCDALITFGATAADDCSTAAPVCVPPSGSRFARGTTLVNCTASDASSNNAACSFSVTIEDLEPPAVACPPAVVTNIAPGSCEVVLEFAAIATDNCAGVTVSCEPPSGSTFVAGTNTVVCIAIDTSGNTDTCAFPVAVLDGQPPVITCPAHISVTTEAGRCDAVATFAATAADNCAQATIACVPPSGSLFLKGVTTVTCAATDRSGNEASCSFAVTVSDQELPTVLCPQGMVLNTEPGRCSARAVFAAEVMDACPGATVACLPPSGSAFPIGTTTVVCQGTDASGNARLCSFDVRVLDGEPPRLVCPDDMVVDTEPTQCTATVAYSVAGDDGCTLTNLMCVPPNGSLFAKGVTGVQCTARDASGNEAACAFNVTVRDTEAPVLLCPTNMVVAARLGGCDATVDFTPSYSDNCPGVNVVCLPPSGSTFALGTTSVSCSAADAAGNTNRCNFTVRVIDTQRPVLTCSSNLIVDCEPNRCDAVVTFSTSVTDNCGAMSISCTPPSGSRFVLGSTPVNCSSTDGGNVGACSFTVTVRDNQSPVVQCPSNIVVSTAAGRCDAPVNFNPSATDNCGPVNMSCFPPGGTTFAIGTTTVTCSAVDGYLNLASCQFTVTVQDFEPPALQCPSDMFVNTATGRCDAIVMFGTQAGDNCSGVNVTCAPPPGSAFPKGTNFVTCTARDASSNSINCTFRIIVRDVEKPQILCPGDQVVSAESNQCRARVNFAPTATDNCNGASVACTPPSNSYFNKGVTTVICVATDTSGNTNRCSFSVTVNDTMPPNISCPANISTNAGPGQISTIVYFASTVADNCQGLSYVCVPQSGSIFHQGVTPVTCTATDASGNTRSCSFMVSVNDNEPPVINCPTNLIIATSIGRCDAVCNYTVTATDNSQGVSLVCVPPSGSVLPKGLTDVLCRATDITSNQVSCGFTITVADFEKPTIACGTNITLITDLGECDARLTYATNATDNCGVASLVCIPPSGVSLPKGTSIVSCTATDTSGNTQTCGFTVRVLDSERPLITCPGKIILNTPPGECDVVANYNASVVDNCPGSTISCSPPSGARFGKGTTTVNCTARDTSGNTAICSFQVEVRDVESPTIICPADITDVSYPDACGSPVMYSPAVQDNCPGATIACIPPSGSMLPVGTNLVNCTGIDASGNSAHCSFRVTIRDVEQPALTCPADILINGSSGKCVPIAVYNPGVQDNCPDAVVQCVPPSGSTFPQGTNRVQCAVFDAGGNMSMCAFSVIVRLQPLTATPLESQTRCAGQSVAFSTIAAGAGPITFQWLKNGAPLAGQSSPSITLSNLTVADSGTYAVVVGGPCGSLTNTASLHVNALVSISGLTNVTRCDCDPLVLSPLVSGTGPFTYAWRKNGSLIPGATSQALTFSKLGTNDAGIYTVDVSGACNSAAASASVGVINVPNPAVYTNSGAITVNDLAPAFPYPSSVRVTCVPRPVNRATVTLRGFTHPYPDDVDVMLTSPNGQCVILMSDSGDGRFANNVNITLDDSAAAALPDAAQLFTGTFRPGNYDTDADVFPVPAPKLPPANTLSALAGGEANGFWSLFVVDDFQLDGGAINNGWVLRLYWESSPVRLVAPRTLANGAFQMTVAGDPGSDCVIEASSDLQTWAPIGNVTITGPETNFTDPSPPSPRFYRARQ